MGRQKHQIEDDTEGPGYVPKSRPKRLQFKTRAPAARFGHLRLTLWLSLGAKIVTPAAGSDKSPCAHEIQI